MIPITRPDGTIVQIAPFAILQFYYDDHQSPQSGTRIDLSVGLQKTPERSEDLAARLHGAMRLVLVHAPPSGQAPGFPIWINVASIRAVRDTPPGTTITVTRAPFLVTEDFATVMRMIDSASGASPLRAAMTNAVATALAPAPAARRAKPKSKPKAKAKKAARKK